MTNNTHNSSESVFEIAQESIKNEWPLNKDGVPQRAAARVVLFDTHGQILLVRGHDFSDPTRSWWFTPGGGIEKNETPRQAAVRELAEETGIELDVKDLIGPVLKRDALFEFAAQTCRQNEEYFMAILPGEIAELDRGGFTDLEKLVLDDLTWWPLDDLEQAQQSGAVIYPRQLPSLARSWQRGWDGKCVEVFAGEN